MSACPPTPTQLPYPRVGGLRGIPTEPRLRLISRQIAPAHRSISLPIAPKLRPASRKGARQRSLRVEPVALGHGQRHVPAEEPRPRHVSRHAP